MTMQQLVKRIALLVVVTVLGILSLTASPAQAQQKQSIDIGDMMPMPDRQMRAVDGSQVALSDVKGQNGTLVVFWSNTCPWVKRYESRVIQIAREYQSKGIGIIAVNPNDPEAYPGEAFAEMQQQARAGDYLFPYVVDDGSQVARAFGASRTPHVYLFDANGEVVYTGAIDDNPRSAADVKQTYLRSALTSLASGNEISKNRTKAFGCAIKWQ